MTYAMLPSRRLPLRLRVSAASCTRPAGGVRIRRLATHAPVPGQAPLSRFEPHETIDYRLLLVKIQAYRKLSVAATSSSGI